MGLLCAFGWQSRAQHRHSAVDLDRLSSGKGGEKISMGTRKTSIDDLKGKATPSRDTAPERDGKATIDWIVPSKRMLCFFCDFYASV